MLQHCTCSIFMNTVTHSEQLRNHHIELFGYLFDKFYRDNVKYYCSVITLRPQDT